MCVFEMVCVCVKVAEVDVLGVNVGNGVRVVDALCVFVCVDECV